MQIRKGPRLSWEAAGTLAGIVVALITVLAYFWPRSAPSPSADVQSRSTPTQSAVVQSVAASEATPSATSSASTGQAAQVLARTSVHLTSGTGVNVDVLPVTVDDPANEESFGTYSGTIHSGEGPDPTTLMAAWSGPGAPTASGCENLLRTQPVADLTDQAGLQFCVEGVFTRRVAAARVVSYDGNVTVVEVTVWAAEMSN